MTISELKDEIVIDENEKFFGFFVKLPLIISFVTAVLYFVLGIVIGVIIESFAAVIVFWVVGAILTIAYYFLLKISFAPMILNIMYIKNISLNSDVLIEKRKTNQTKLSTQSSISYQAWTCPKCGEKNNYAAKNCINCFEPKP